MRTPSLAALAALLVLPACTLGPTRPDPEADARARLGAVDEAFRRPAVTPQAGIFDPLPLPTPTEVRLGSGAPGPDYWQQRVDYRIDARLDAVAQRLDADMTVTYHNNSPHTLDYLWIQLEQNLFRQDSLGTLSRGRGVMAELTGDFNGGYDISHIRHSGLELEHRAYDTLARVELPEPIGPGETFTFDVGFAFDMPPHLRRMGSEKVEQGTIFEYAQWFPHVCNYDDVNGWNALPYLGSGEFYTNFGDYEVNLTVPRSHIVSATGLLQNPDEVLTAAQRERLEQARASADTVLILTPEEVGTPESRPQGDGPLTWRFKAQDVRTFAWASSEAFIWDACAATIHDLDGSPRTVLCQSFYPREATSWYWNAESKGSTQVIRHTIEFVSPWLYPYPYPVMSNINGPEGGMEYPMIMFCGARTNDRGMVGVTDHETGHTWFPMLVNSDERRYMWQDEGFNSFLGIYSMAAWYDRDPDIDGAIRQTLRVATADNRQRIDLAPDRHWGTWIGALNYRKTALALFLLREEVLGPQRFDTAFREYIHRWAFKHPQPADFFRTMEDAAGADLAWFWRGWILSDTTLDQGLADVSYDNGTLTLDLTNNADMVMPVHARITYEDGSTEDRRLPVEIWGSTSRWRVAWPTAGRTPVKVELDPDRRYPDLDRSNNAWPKPPAQEEPQDRPSTRRRL